MELKKLHMGTMSYGFDSMDEVSHQLALAFGVNTDQRELPTALSSFPYGSLVSHGITTGAQLASRGRRDMSSRVRDVVVSLGLCHNVRSNCQLFQGY